MIEFVIGSIASVLISEFSKKPKFKKGGLFDRDTMAGGHQYTVFFDLNGRRTSRKVFANTSSSAESWIKFQYPEARNISSRKEY